MTAPQQIALPLAVQLYRRELEGRPCRPVEPADCPSLAILVEQMIGLCRAQKATGLAAPQVGCYLQLAVLLPAPGQVEILVNPEVRNLAGRDLLGTESCLSLPPTAEATARVWRSEVVHVASGTVEDPTLCKVTVYKGAAARLAQHEIDHLRGVFFIERCGPVGRQIVLRQFSRFLRAQRPQSPVDTQLKYNFLADARNLS